MDSEQEREHEIVGRGSMSRVWRVGATIRRERGPHSAAVAALLCHLDARGYPYSPRHLGVDGRGRDVLSLLPGDPVPTLRGERQLRQVGRMLAGFAVAARDFPDPTGRVWRTPGEPAPVGETVIHGDVAPWNMLERNGVVTGLVDVDSARPGRAVEDVAYAAWHLTPVHDELLGDGRPPPPVRERPRRLRVFADACGLEPSDRTRLVEEVARVQVTQAARVAAGALVGDRPTERHRDAGRFTAPLARSLDWLGRHRDVLEAALR